MPEHVVCEQQDNISHIHRTLDRMEETQRQLVDVLKEVAAQTVRVDNLEDKTDQHFHDMNSLFDRVRILEIKDGKIDTIINIFSNKYFVTAIAGLTAMIIVGAILDLVYHYETVKKILVFFK